MKKLIYILFFFFIYKSSFSQILHYGVKGGINFSNFRDDKVGNYDFETATNYHFGGFIEFKFFNNLYIQPELLYSTVGTQFKNSGFKVKNQLNYLSIPLIAKVYINDNNFSIEVGPQFSVLVSESNKIGNSSEGYEIGAVAGLGLKLSRTIYLQGRYIIGLSDIKEKYNVKNSTIQVSIGFIID